MHSDLWMAGREFRKKGDKRVQSPDHGRTNAQSAGGLLVRSDRPFGFSNVLQDLSTCSQEINALVRETDATRGTVQKGGAEPVFEAQNCPAHRTLAHAKLGRSGRKAPRVGDRL